MQRHYSGSAQNQDLPDYRIVRIGGWFRGVWLLHRWTGYSGFWVGLLLDGMVDSLPRSVSGIHCGRCQPHGRGGYARGFIPSEWVSLMEASSSEVATVEFARVM